MEDKKNQKEELEKEIEELQKQVEIEELKKKTKTKQHSFTFVQRAEYFIFY